MIKFFEEYSLNSEIDDILNIARDENLIVNVYDKYPYTKRLMIEIMREGDVSIESFKIASLNVHRRITALDLHKHCNILIYASGYCIDTGLSFEDSMDGKYDYDFTGVELIYHN